MKKKVVLLDTATRHERKYWVHPINERRDDLGLYATLVQELRADDTGHHSQYMRMTVENFDIILGLVELHLRRQDTVMRPAIEPGLKIAVTLHHLAEGASHVAIAAHYRLGRSTVSRIIYETCEALWTVLQPVYLKAPSGPNEWLNIAKG